MWNDVYLESRVLSADPVELVAILYEGALGAVEQARRRLVEGDIAARSAAISKGVGILAELSGSLNHAIGGELSQRLAELYDYMQRRLLEANFQQSETPLTEVARLLRVLAEGWSGIKAKAGKPDLQPSASWGAGYVETGGFAEECAASYAGQGWSF
jgi:flagellar protein FliS